MGDSTITLKELITIYFFAYLQNKKINNNLTFLSL